MSDIFERFLLAILRQFVQVTHDHIAQLIFEFQDRLDLKKKLPGFP